MQFKNQSMSGWPLAEGQALRHVAGSARLLRVARGRIWVTRDGSLNQPAEDCVLTRGEVLSLNSGQAVVIEAWSDSEMEFLEPRPGVRA